MTEKKKYMKKYNVTDESDDCLMKALCMFVGDSSFKWSQLTGKQ